MNEENSEGICVYERGEFRLYEFSMVVPRFSIATDFATLRITLSIFPSFSPSVAAFDNLKYVSFSLVLLFIQRGLAFAHSLTNVTFFCSTARTALVIFSWSGPSRSYWLFSFTYNVSRLTSLQWTGRLYRSVFWRLSMKIFDMPST
jgi:hypothetical protein